MKPLVLVNSDSTAKPVHLAKGSDTGTDEGKLQEPSAAGNVASHEQHRNNRRLKLGRVKPLHAEQQNETDGTAQHGGAAEYRSNDRGPEQRRDLQEPNTGVKIRTFSQR